MRSRPATSLLRHAPKMGPRNSRRGSALLAQADSDLIFTPGVTGQTSFNIVIGVRTSWRPPVLAIGSLGTVKLNWKPTP